MLVHVPVRYRIGTLGEDHIVLTGSPPECANFDWQICVQVVLEFTLVVGSVKWEMGYG